MRTGTAQPATASPRRSHSNPGYAREPKLGIEPRKGTRQLLGEALLSLKGTNSMAIRTNKITLGDLCQDRRPTPTVGSHSRDSTHLFPTNMVPLHSNGMVRDLTVSAGNAFFQAAHPISELLLPPRLPLYVLLRVGTIPLLVQHLTALFAHGLVSSTAPMEISEGPLRFTVSTSLHALDSSRLVQSMRAPGENRTPSRCLTKTVLRH